MSVETCPSLAPAANSGRGSSQMRPPSISSVESTRFGVARNASASAASSAGLRSARITSTATAFGLTGASRLSARAMGRRIPRIPLAIHQGQFVDRQHHGFRRRNFRRPVGAEHTVVSVVVDLRTEDVTDEEGKAERGRKQPHVRRRTVPGQSKRKAHFSLQYTGGRSALFAARLLIGYGVTDPDEIAEEARNRAPGTSLQGRTKRGGVVAGGDLQQT